MPKGDRDIGKADPEDGTTPIANLLLEAIAVANLSGKKKGALSFLWRRTYGWEDKERKKVGQQWPRKTEDIITLQEWSLALKTDVSYASRIIEDLAKKKIIERFPLGTGKGYRYRLNTKVDEWDKSCINLQELSEFTRQELFKHSTLRLYKKTTPSATDLASSKERLNKEKEKSSRGGLGGTATRGYRSEYTFDMLCRDRERAPYDIGLWYSERETDQGAEILADFESELLFWFGQEYEDEIKGHDYGSRFLGIANFLAKYRECLILEGLMWKEEETGKVIVKDEIIKVLLDSFSPPKDPDPKQSYTWVPTSRLIKFAQEDDFDKAKSFQAILPLLKE